MSGPPFGTRFLESGVVFVFPADGAWLNSSRPFRNEMVSDFDNHRAIDLRQPQDRLTRQGRRKDQDRSHRVREADPHRIHVVHGRRFQDDRMHDVQRDTTRRGTGGTRDSYRFYC